MDANLVEAAVRSALVRDFKWGSDDCCTFVCDVIKNVTGRDLMESLRGLYLSEDDANAIMGSSGLVGIGLKLAGQQGLENVPFPFVDADLGIVATPQGPALALYVKGRFVARAKRGIVYLPAEAGIIAWRIA